MADATVQGISPFNPAAFVDFKLKKIEHYNHNSSTLTFELPGGQSSLIPVASCVQIQFVDVAGKGVIRAYTPISQPDIKGEIVFIVKRYETGTASKHIHSLKVGDSLSFKGPFVKFPYQANQFEHVILLGGGSGITPLYQVAKHALNKDNKTIFTLIFGNISEVDILLREELDALHKEFPETFKLVYALSKPESSWTGAKGYINAELLKQHAAPTSLNDKVKVFVCGPPGQVASLAGPKDGGNQGELGGVLKELGFTADQVFKF